MRSEVSEQIQELDMVGSKVDVGYWNFMGPGVIEGCVHATTMDEGGRIFFFREFSLIRIQCLLNWQRSGVAFKAQSFPVLFNPSTRFVSNVGDE